MDRHNFSCSLPLFGLHGGLFPNGWRTATGPLSAAPRVLVDVNLEIILCGTCVEFEVSPVAVTNTVGAFFKPFAAGKYVPSLAQRREFLLGFAAVE